MPWDFYSATDTAREFIRLMCCAKSVHAGQNIPLKWTKKWAMPDFEEDCSITCPYCGASFSMRVDLTGGQNQSLTYDCEICCRPIAVQIDIDPDGVVNLFAERES